MEQIIIIGITAFGASLLTFFSGFGLGTLLTPVMALFFALPEAIAVTGIVHLLNNLFKLVLVGKKFDKQVAIKFALPSIIGAIIGAFIIVKIGKSTTLFSYCFINKLCEVTGIKIILSTIMIFFALFELLPKLKNISFEKNKIWIGGFISGFFGGLSGNQGALRSAFLLRFGLSKESFIATGIVIACMIDFVRLTIYFNTFLYLDFISNYDIFLVAIICAFTGAFLGSKLLSKVTFGFVQLITSILIILIAIAIGLGFV